MFLIEPSRVPTEDQRASKARQHHQTFVEKEQVTVYDGYNQTFTVVYRLWYNHMPLIGPVKERPSFNFWHIQVMIFLAFGVGAPFAFYFLHNLDDEKAKDAMKSANWDEWHRLQAEFEKKERELLAKKEALDRDRGRLEFRIQQRENEIERLTRREEYLTKQAKLTPFVDGSPGETPKPPVFSDL